MVSSWLDLFDSSGAFPGGLMGLASLFDSGLASVRSLISLTGLVFLCIALYVLSKRRGYNKPWLGAIPVVNGYALGGIADNICYYKGKKTHFRIWLLVGNILGAGMGLLAAGAMVSIFVAVFSGMDLTVKGGEQADFFLGLTLALGIVLIAAAVGSIVCQVFRFIALYHIYLDYAPNMAVVFLLLSIFLGAFGLEGVILFVLRDKTPVSLAPALPPPPVYSPHTYR